MDVTDTINVYSECDFEGPLEETIDMLTRLYNQNKEKYVNIQCYIENWDEYRIDYVVYGTRKETEEERRKRLERLKKEREKKKKYKEDKKRKLVQEAKKLGIKPEDLK